MFNFSFAARGIYSTKFMWSDGDIDNAATDKSRHELCPKKSWDQSFGDQNVPKIRVICGIF